MGRPMRNDGTFPTKSCLKNEDNAASVVTDKSLEEVELDMLGNEFQLSSTSWNESDIVEENSGDEKGEEEEGTSTIVTDDYKQHPLFGMPTTSFLEGMAMTFLNRMGGSDDDDEEETISFISDEDDDGSSRAEVLGDTDKNSMISDGGDDDASFLNIRDYNDDGGDDHEEEVSLAVLQSESKRIALSLLQSESKRNGRNQIASVSPNISLAEQLNGVNLSNISFFLHQEMESRRNEEDMEQCSNVDDGDGLKQTKSTLISSSSAPKASVDANEEKPITADDEGMIFETAEPMNDVDRKDNSPATQSSAAIPVTPDVSAIKSMAITSGCDHEEEENDSAQTRDSQRIAPSTYIGEESFRAFAFDTKPNDVHRSPTSAKPINESDSTLSQIGMSLQTVPQNQIPVIVGTSSATNTPNSFKDIHQPSLPYYALTDGTGNRSTPTRIEEHTEETPKVCQAYLTLNGKEKNLCRPPSPSTASMTSESFYSVGDANDELLKLKGLLQRLREENNSLKAQLGTCQESPSPLNTSDTEQMDILDLDNELALDPPADLLDEEPSMAQAPVIANEELNHLFAANDDDDDERLTFVTEVVLDRTPSRTDDYPDKHNTDIQESVYVQRQSKALNFAGEVVRLKDNEDKHANEHIQTIAPVLTESIDSIGDCGEEKEHGSNPKNAKMEHDVRYCLELYARQKECEELAFDEKLDLDHFEARRKESVGQASPQVVEEKPKTPGEPDTPNRLNEPGSSSHQEKARWEIDSQKAHEKQPPKYSQDLIQENTFDNGILEQNTLFPSKTTVGRDVQEALLSSRTQLERHYISVSQNARTQMDVAAKDCKSVREDSSHDCGSDTSSYVWRETLDTYIQPLLNTYPSWLGFDVDEHGYNLCADRSSLAESKETTKTAAFPAESYHVNNKQQRGLGDKDIQHCSAQESVFSKVEQEISELQAKAKSMKRHAVTELVTQICCELDQIDMKGSDELRNRRKDLIRKAEHIDRKAHQREKKRENSATIQGKWANVPSRSKTGDKKGDLPVTVQSTTPRTRRGIYGAKEKKEIGTKAPAQSEPPKTPIRVGDTNSDYRKGQLKARTVNFATGEVTSSQIDASTGTGDEEEDWESTFDAWAEMKLSETLASGNGLSSPSVPSLGNDDEKDIRGLVPCMSKKEDCVGAGVTESRKWPAHSLFGARSRLDRSTPRKLSRLGRMFPKKVRPKSSDTAEVDDGKNDRASAPTKNTACFPLAGNAPARTSGGKGSGFGEMEKENTVNRLPRTSLRLERRRLLSLKNQAKPATTPTEKRGMEDQKEKAGKEGEMAKPASTSEKAVSGGKASRLSRLKRLRNRNWGKKGKNSGQPARDESSVFVSTD